jgi:acetoin utilization deacetylase AcuC-like enzyme
MTQRPLSIFWDERVLDHDTGFGFWEAEISSLVDEVELHPENALRIQNMRSVLQRGPISGDLDWRSGRLATRDELLAVHDADYVDFIKQSSDGGGARLTSTTVLAPGSWIPLLAAAGTVLEAADAVIKGSSERAFALVRPPGHHAQPGTADGYCFFSHAALVAQRARDAGFERVAIVDWDVHHGNGSQECFYDRCDVLTSSIHMDHGSWGPTHPQTGRTDELGSGIGRGFSINIPLPFGAGDQSYETALRTVIAPVLRQFKPTFLVASIGQDASTFDANGRHNVTMQGFNALGRALREVADELTDGRMVMVQEGGYARSYSAFCLHATLEGILGRPSQLPDPLAYLPDDTGRLAQRMSDIQQQLSPYWKFDEQETR